MPEGADQATREGGLACTQLASQVYDQRRLAQAGHAGAQLKRRCVIFEVHPDQSRAALTSERSGENRSLASRPR